MISTTASANYQCQLHTRGITGKMNRFGFCTGHGADISNSLLVLVQRSVTPILMGHATIFHKCPL